MAVSVALGAFGAHGLKTRLDADALGQWRTGVEYQFMHALGMLILASLHGRFPSRAITWSRNLFLAGICCFSGSLYLLSTRGVTGFDELGAVVGPITPVGGLFFVTGWLLLLINAWRGPADR